MQKNKENYLSITINLLTLQVGVVKLVKTTFEKILRTTKHRINRNILTTTLNNLGYSIKKSSFGLNGFKFRGSGSNRFHFEVEMATDGEIYKSCEVRLHQDLGRGLFHGVKTGGEDISIEWNSFRKELMKQLKTSNR